MSAGGALGAKFAARLSFLSPETPALLIHPGLQLLQRLPAADAHFHFMFLEAFYYATSAGLDAGAEPFHVGFAIGHETASGLGGDGTGE
jgi:hypothetical protein